jgi:hypothetical protein
MWHYAERPCKGPLIFLAAYARLTRDRHLA